MMDELQQPLPESKSENHPVVPNNISQAPKKQNKTLRIILGIVAVITCFISILCIGLAVTGVGKSITEKAPIESVLDTFMKNMEAKDYESAFTLFSPRVQRQMSITNLKKLTEGNNYLLFIGYQNLSIQRLSFTATVNTNPDLPQGTVANAAGTISYEGDFIGNFSAVLEKVDGTWRLHYINVIVPPDKFQP